MVPEEKSLVPVSLNLSLGDGSTELAWLLPEERYALDYWNQHRSLRGRAETWPLAPDVSAGLFALYLQGRSLADLRVLNHPRFSMGQIVHAAVDGQWWTRRQAYLGEVLDRAKTRAVQAAAEGVEFVADALAAGRKLHGEALQRYLQSGNPADAGAFLPATPRQYRELVDLLRALTGQDQKGKSVQVSTSVEVRLPQIPTQAPKYEPTEVRAVLGAWAKAEREKILKAQAE